MFNSLFGLAKDALEIADAAVSIPVAIVRVATKPIAEGAKEIKEEIQRLNE